MVTISDLPDELLVKILSFLPTEVAVSTSILSKRWVFLWMWLSDLEFNCDKRSVRGFINKYLPLLRSPIINSLSLSFLERTLEDETKNFSFLERTLEDETKNFSFLERTLEDETKNFSFHERILEDKTKNFKSWVEIAVSRRVRELICNSYNFPYYEWQIGSLVLATSLYTCSSLVTLKLVGLMIFVDVPEMVCLPSLKTLHLSCVKYSNEDSLGLLLRSCPVLEDLLIKREWNLWKENDNIVIKIPSLQRLSIIDVSWSSVGSVIATPSLKYLKVEDCLCYIPYLTEHMPELEEAEMDVTADIDIEKLFKSITTVKRLTLHITFNEGVYHNGIVFSRLENLKIYLYDQNWSKMIFRLLKDSPNLQILDLEIHQEYEGFGEYNPMSWSINESSVPKCLLKSLKTFKFKGHYEEEEEQRNFIRFISKHACCLESTLILPSLCYVL